jgi:hypothetical protein
MTCNTLVRTEALNRSLADFRNTSIKVAVASLFTTNCPKRKPLNLDPALIEQRGLWWQRGRCLFMDLKHEKLAWKSAREIERLTKFARFLCRFSYFVGI